MAQEIDARFTSDEWLFQKGRLQQHGVKIHEDVRVVEAAFKAQGGLIRVVARLCDGRIDDVALSGDFTVLPSLALAALEQSVRGMQATPETLSARLQAAYDLLSIQSPGVSPSDFAAAIMSAVAPPKPA